MGVMRLPPPKEGEEVGVGARRKIMKKEKKEEAKKEKKQKERDKKKKSKPLKPKLEFDDPFVHPPDEPLIGGYHYPTVPTPLTLLIDEPIEPPQDEPPPPPPRQNRDPDQPPPPLPPVPQVYQKTSLKEMEKRQKKLNKEITKLEKQLIKLNLEKDQLASCADFFETDPEDFIKQVETYSTCSTSSDDEETKDTSSTPPPVPPKPPEISFIIALGCALYSAIPSHQRQWTSRRSGYAHSRYFGEDQERRREKPDEPPLPEPFTLFGSSAETRFTNAPAPEWRSPSPTPRPQPRTPSPKSGHRRGCCCYECVTGQPYPHPYGQ